jgi:metal-sulfur cluster biosynthetic enzyme
MRAWPVDEYMRRLCMADETGNAESAEIVGATDIDVEEIYAALRECYDPEIPVNIVDLGLVYHLKIEGPRVFVTMSLTSIGCPVGPEVMAEVEGRVKDVPGVESCDVALTFDPPLTPDRMTEDAKWELGIG